MNNRYLYRAKRTDNGEWVIGNLLFDIEKEKPFETFRIYPVNYVDLCRIVDPSTICQCTGLKRFFEKDIVERTDLHKVGDPSIGIIEYDVENTAFVIHWIDREKYSPMYPWKDKIKVFGNIFDNPELLEVGE